jgi:Ras association domain-containing protein 7/8
MLRFNQDFQQSEGDSLQETVLYNAQYRDLVRLVNCQREKLSVQQAELTKV